MNKQKDRLVALLEQAREKSREYFRSAIKKSLAEKKRFNSKTDVRSCIDVEADHLLVSGVIVPPCKVGDVAHFLIEDPVLGEKYISSEPVTDVCTKGFYTSGHKDSDENGDLWLWSDVGEIVFLDKTKADEALKGGKVNGK